MMHFTVDSRSNSASVVDANGCQTCCCETVHVRAGETTPLVINYAPWAVPFARKGLECMPQFDIEQIATCPVPTGTDLPPVAVSPVWFAIALGATTNENLNTRVGDPEGQRLTYKLLPFYGTHHGKLDLQSDGAFVYTPDQNWWGYDSFFFEVTDGTTAPVTMECIFAVGNVAAPTSKTFTPKIKVVGVKVDTYAYLTSFAIAVSPAAKPCEIFRMNVRQGALDCDCNCYHHISCWDIRVGSC